MSWIWAGGSREKSADDEGSAASVAWTPQRPWNFDIGDRLDSARRAQMLAS